jgi:hypothetical protein
MSLIIKNLVPREYSHGRFQEIIDKIEQAFNVQAVEPWTPGITFATPGNLSVTYSTQIGNAVRQGRNLTVSFTIQTSAFTHTTASGDLRITGLPAEVADMTNLVANGSIYFSGINKASYTSFMANAVAGQVYMLVYAAGNGASFSTVKAADMPTGGTVVIAGSLTYPVDHA